MSLVGSFAGTILNTTPVGGAAQTIASTFGISLKESSDSIAKKVVGSVVSAANAGNLYGVAILDTRRTFGISAERAVWSSGYSQVSPQVIAAYTPVRDKVIAQIPQSAQAGPAQAAAFVAGNRLTVDEVKRVDTFGSLPSGVQNVLGNPKTTTFLGWAALIVLGGTVAVSVMRPRAAAA